MACLNERTSTYDMVKLIIKDELKKNLKVNTSIQFPMTFNDGYILTEVFYDEEKIYSNNSKISKGSTIFSF